MAAVIIRESGTLPFQADVCGPLQLSYIQFYFDPRPQLQTSACSLVFSAILEQTKRDLELVERLRGIHWP